MEKLVKRFLFGDLYNIESYEEYFADMSRKGLHLEGVGTIFAYFKEGDPEYLNYRIDMFKKDEKDIKIKEHKEKGWQFVEDREPFLIFSSKENSGLEELYQTPEEQRLALKHAMKKNFCSNISEFIIGILAILTLIVVTYFNIEGAGGLFLLIAKGGLLITIVPVLISIVKLIRQEWHIYRIMRTLKSGEFLTHYGNHFLERIGFIFSNLAFLLTIVFSIYQIYQGGTMHSEEIARMKDLPIISVIDIEKEDNDSTLEYDSYLYKNWSPLVPKKYDLDEFISNDDYGEEGYSSRLFVEYYLGRFDYIAKGLERDILSIDKKKYKVKLNKILEKHELVCYGGEDGNQKVLLCRKGPEVILVRYFDGKVSLDRLMKAVIDKLEDK